MVLVQNVSKLYRLFQRPADRIREILPFSSKPLHTDFWALKDISFQLERGEFLGLVGPNGCGKSTLLQIVSGILQPTTGRVVTRGRIAALLELHNVPYVAIDRDPDGVARQRAQGRPVYYGDMTRTRPEARRVNT